MSIYRMLWCSLRVLWSDKQYDIIFVDQVSAVIPFLKLKKNAKVVYYCHYPDLLLAQNKTRPSLIKEKYRMVIDWFESITTANCDELLVNSKFTKSVVLKTFPFLKQMPFLEPKVVYPAINTKQYQSINDKITNKRITFLSINRYERKKQVDLAIKALNKLLSMVKNKENIKLIIAGGYDERVSENKEYFNELIEFCKNMQLNYQFLAPEMLERDQDDEKINDDALILDNKNVDTSASIYFITKFPDSQKEALLKECSAVLYTPQNEHFGIVPIEGMLAMRPVIACKSGGPLETIIDGETGYLCESKEDEWANAMKKIVDDKELVIKLGKAGRQRVIENFGRKELEKVMEKVVNDVKDKRFSLPPEIRAQTWLIIALLLWTFVNVTPILLVLSKL